MIESYNEFYVVDKCIEKTTYHGLVHNLSNCSNMNRMHDSLNDIALKPSDNSYMRETFSTEISLCDDNKNASDHFSCADNVYSKQPLT
jgi:hypothetical protein